MPTLPGQDKSRAYEIYMDGKDFISIIDPYLVITKGNYKSYLNGIHLKCKCPDYEVIRSLINERNNRISSRIAERILSNYHLDPTSIRDII